MNKKWMRVCWLIAAIAWMALIFSFSHTEGEQSQQQSTIVTTIVTEVIGVEPTHKDFLAIEITVRKVAHLCMFAVLGFIYCGYFDCYKIDTKKKYLFSCCASLGYAVLDETHQYFIPGRAAKLFDVAIDTAGGALGAVGFLLLSVIITKIIKCYKKKKGIMG